MIYIYSDIYIVIYIYIMRYIYIPLRAMPKSLLPMFSSRSFMVSDLTFKSLINFEFIFIYGVRKWSSFIFLHVSVQFSQHHLLQKLLLLHCMLWPPLSDIIYHKAVGLFLGCLFCSIDLYTSFCANTMLF